MTDLIRGARPVADAIARRLERIGVPLTQAERQRLETVCASKTKYEVHCTGVPFYVPPAPEPPRRFVCASCGKEFEAQIARRCCSRPCTNRDYKVRHGLYGSREKLRRIKP